MKLARSVKVDINLVNYACIVYVYEMRHRVHKGDAVQNSKTFQVLIKGSSNSFQGHNPSNKANKGRCKPSTTLCKIHELIKNLQRDPPTVFKDTTMVQ